MPPLREPRPLLTETEAMFLRELGKRLRAARKAAGLTQPQVAAAIHRDRKTLWRIEHGHGVTTEMIVAKLADLYGVEDWGSLWREAQEAVGGSLNSPAQLPPMLGAS
jgi:transcriptional regulator with XRE-family HTH domain